MKNLILMIVFVLSFSLVSFAQCKDSAGQRAAFQELTPTEKVALWREHLQTELKTRGLNQDQRDLVQLGLSMVTEDFYTTPQSDKAYVKFREDLRANFSLKEGSEIFEQLPLYKGKGDGETANRIECNCSTTWTFCDYGSCQAYNCYGCPCSKVINCGPFWGFQCNGLCQ